MLFPIVEQASLLRCRVSPSRFRSRLTRAIFCERRFDRPSLYGVSRQHKPTKVIPKTAQVTQLSVGKDVGPELTAENTSREGNPRAGNGFALISVEGLGGKERDRKKWKREEERDIDRDWEKEIKASVYL